MRKALTVLAAAAIVAALATPAFSESARRPSDQRVMAARDHGHSADHDGGRGRHGDRDDRRGFHHGDDDRYHRHYYRDDDDRYSYGPPGPPYYDPYYWGSYCNYAYYYDRYYFVRYCEDDHDYHGYAVNATPDPEPTAADQAPGATPAPSPAPAPAPADQATSPG